MDLFAAKPQVSRAPALPVGARQLADGAVELLMTAFHDEDEFDAAGTLVVQFLSARFPVGARLIQQFEYVPGRRVTIVRVLENPRAADA